MVTKKCFKCGKKAQIQFKHSEGALCDAHFIHSIEKRIRKEVREKDIKPKQKYSILKENNHRFELTKYFLKKVFNELISLKPVNKNAYIMPTSLDLEAEKFLKGFRENKNTDEEGIKPLRSVLELELKEVCRILNMEYTETKTSEELDKFEKEFPGTKFSILKSIKSYDEHRKSFE